MDEIPEGLEDLLKDILGDEEKKPSPQSSSALAVIPKVEKEEEDLVDDEIDERILTLLGLEDVTDIDYSTYKSLLREKVAAARMSDSKMSTEEAELITNEFKRVKKLTGRFKVKKKKINVESFFETAQEKTESKENKEDKEDIPDGLDDLINEIREEVDLKKPDEVTSEESEEEEKDDKAEKFIKLTLAPSLSKIEKNLESILGTLTKQFQFDKKQSEKAADVAQTTRKREREKKSEGKIGGSKVKDTADKVVKPVKGMFDMIMDFFKNILLGGALLWLLDFLKNPEKAFQPIIDAINGIIDFLNDVIKTTFDFVFAPVNDALSGIWDGLNFLEDRLNDATALFGQEPIDNINEENKPKFEAPQIPKVENPFKKPESTPVQGMQGGGIVSSSMGNTSNLINNTNNKSINISDMSFTGGGSITSNSGQTITGMGADTQLIAVQPGEIVMSKPAVNYYGASNLLAMNKEGGGTNKPKVGKVMGMQGGGLVGDVTFSAGHFSTGFKNGVPVGSDGRPVQGTDDSNSGSSRYKRGGALYGMDPTGVAEYQATTHLINTMQGMVSGTPLSNVIKFRNIATWNEMSSVPRQVESNPGSQFIDLHFDARGYGKAGVLPGGNESPVDRALVGSYGRYYSDGYRPSKAVTNAGGTLLEMASIDDPSVRPYLMEVKSGQTGPASLTMAKKLLLSTLTGIKGGEEMKQYIGGTKSTTPASILQPTPTNNNNTGSRTPNATVTPPKITSTQQAPPKAPAPARFTGVVLPTMQQSRNKAPSSGSVMSGKKLPNISPIDLGNTELMVIKAIYNIVG